MSPLHGAISLPFVLVSDLLQVGAVISSMYMQAERVTNEISLNTSLSREGAPEGWLKVTGDGLPTAWQRARYNHDQLQNIGSKQAPATYWSGYYYADSLAFSTDYVGRHAVKSLSFPIRATLGTAYNGAVVESAWRNMKRRTNNIFYPPARAYDQVVENMDDNDVSYQCKAKSETMECVEGGRFFQYLLKRIQEKSGYEYDITLVGHSMGTIVLNNAFKRYRPDWIKSGVVRNIVYMAAAASIRDTMDSLFPILQAINTAETEDSTPIRFYNLTLNRLAEISETTVLSFLPNGSLLVNIDDHLEKPETLLDRTIGQEVNVLSVLPVIRQALSGAAKHTQFKSFDRYSGCGPDAHGGFNDMPFWRKSFWTVSAQPQPTAPANNTSCPHNAYPKTCLDSLKKKMKTLQNESLEQYLSQWCKQ